MFKKKEKKRPDTLIKRVLRQGPSIPPSLLKKIGVKRDDFVELKVEGSQIIITPIEITPKTEVTANV